MSTTTGVDAIATAEQTARQLHDAGRCSESEWSCSFCEAIAEGLTVTACPGWCVSAHDPAEYSEGSCCTHEADWIDLAAPSGCAYRLQRTQVERATDGSDGDRIEIESPCGPGVIKLEDVDTVTDAVRRLACGTLAAPRLSGRHRAALGDLTLTQADVIADLFGIKPIDLALRIAGALAEPAVRGV
jgi:hypothetical protein